MRGWIHTKFLQFDYRDLFIAHPLFQLHQPLADFPGMFPMGGEQMTI